MNQSDFRTIDPTQLKDNPFKLVGTDWMLITAGTAEAFNTMTGAWGGMGVLWQKHVCFCFVRPVRHTYGYMESSDFFSLSFFDERHRDALAYCGSHSGRDVDKIKETGLTPLWSDKGIYFAEANLVFLCRKVYYHDLDPTHFLYPSTDSTHYPQKDYHRLYVGEIASCLAGQR
jgi:flavin reductase (DIM6/NTAB) family NADH-FMN oxidoreductase RutF